MTAKISANNQMEVLRASITHPDILCEIDKEEKLCSLFERFLVIPKERYWNTIICQNSVEITKLYWILKRYNGKQPVDLDSFEQESKWFDETVELDKDQFFVEYRSIIESFDTNQEVGCVILYQIDCSNITPDKLMDLYELLLKYKVFHLAFVDCKFSKNQFPKNQFPFPSESLYVSIRESITLIDSLTYSVDDYSSDDDDYDDYDDDSYINYEKRLREQIERNHKNDYLSDDDY